LVWIYRRGWEYCRYRCDVSDLLDCIFGRDFF